MSGLVGSGSDGVARDASEDTTQHAQAPPSPLKKGTRKSVLANPANSSPRFTGRSRRAISDDVVFGIASNIFINLRVNASILSALWSVDDKPIVDLCKNVILDCVFPDDGSIETELQLSRLLGKFVFLEVANCKHIETLLRDNSLAALMASSYCKRKFAQTFLRENMDPILQDTLLDSNIHNENSERTRLSQLLLQKIVSVVCAKVHSLPIGLAFIAENIFAGLKAIPVADSGDDAQGVNEHMAACAVGSIVFLRFIVPYIAMYDQENAKNLPASEHASMRKFFMEAASCLMKMSNGTLFPPSHSLSVLNETVNTLSASVQSAFFRISTDIALERIVTASSVKSALSMSIQVGDLLKFMKVLVSVKDSMVAHSLASDDDTSSHQSLFASIDEFASLSEQTIASCKCVAAKSPVLVPLADVASFSLDSLFSSMPSISITKLTSNTSKEDAFTDVQLKVISEAASVVQDVLSGRSFHNARPAVSLNSRFSCITPIAFRMTRSIIFQRVILVLCLLHCFMAIYETRPFKDHKTRALCLQSTPDESALTNIFVSESVILFMYWAFFLSKVFTRSGRIGGWSLVQLFVTSVLSIDLLYNWVNHSVNGAPLFRFGTPLRPVMQIVRTTQIAHALRRHLHELYFTIMSAKYCLIVGVIMNIFVRTVCAGCDSVGCLVKADDGSSREKMCSLFYTRFSSSGKSIMTSFILITASNYNTIAEMLLAYMDQSDNKVRALLFLVFLIMVVIIGYFLLLPLLLAVVVSSFRKARQKSVDKENDSKQLALASTFALLSSIEGGSDTISERVYFCFMKACELKFSDKEIALFFQYLDTDLSKTLSIDEFSQLLDIMSLSLRKGLGKRILHYFIDMGTIGKGHIHFRKFFQHRRFRIFISIVIFINVGVYIWMGYIPSAIRKSDNINFNSSHAMFSQECVSVDYASSCKEAQAAETIDFCLFLIYCVELLLSFASYGLSSLFMPWIIFNFGLVSFSSVFYILAYLGFGVSPVYVSVFRLVNLVRVLRLFELSINFKALLQSVRGSLRGFSSFIIFSVSTVFSWAFIALLMLQCNQVGGSFDPDNINGTPINFDSLAGSVLSLFQITVVDNWDDFIWSALESKSLAYGGIYSLYFLAFFVILVLVITNVLTSSIIEAYDEQVKFEEEKLKPTSHTTGSVFIDGVEFVRMGATMSQLSKSSESGGRRNRDSVRTWRSSASSHNSKLLRSETGTSAGAPEGNTYQVADSLRTMSASATVLPSQEEDAAADETSTLSSAPVRHPSLIVKLGSLNSFKSSSGKLSTRWCSLNINKFRMFSQNNRLKKCVAMGALDRVDSVFNSGSILSFPIVLHHKRKFRAPPVVLCATSAEDQQDWITVFNEALLYLRRQHDSSSEPEKTWREYVLNCSKEGGKVLNQLIEALLNPVDDVQRYICVLEHLCWVADELGESEIICPIVEYANQLIPQLQRSFRISKLSLRNEPLGNCTSSDSDSSSNGGGARGKTKDAAGSFPVQSQKLRKVPSSPKLNVSRVINSLGVAMNQRSSDSTVGTTPNASLKPTTKSAVLAVMANHYMQNAGKTLLSSSHSSGFQSQPQAEVSQFELGEVQDATNKRVSQVAGGHDDVLFELENLLDELGGNPTQVVAASHPPRSAASVSASFQANRPSPMKNSTTGMQSHTSSQHVLQQMQALAEMQAVILAASKSPDKRVPSIDEASETADHHRQQDAGPAELPATRVQSPLLALQQQQEQALAELRSMLMHRSSEEQRSQQQHQDRDHDRQQEIQHQNLTHLSQESTVNPAPIPARALQQQQQDALAELRAVLSQAPRASSSSAILNAPPAVHSPVEAPFDVQPSSSTATLSQPATDAPHAPQQHLQRSPRGPSDDENSDSDFDQFLRVLDSS